MHGTGWWEGGGGWGWGGVGAGWREEGARGYEVDCLYHFLRKSVARKRFEPDSGVCKMRQSLSRSAFQATLSHHLHISITKTF